MSNNFLLHGEYCEQRITAAPNASYFLLNEQGEGMGPTGLVQSDSAGSGLGHCFVKTQSISCLIYSLRTNAQGHLTVSSAGLFTPQP